MPMSMPKEVLLKCILPVCVMDTRHRISSSLARVTLTVKVIDKPVGLMLRRAVAVSGRVDPSSITETYDNKTWFYSAPYVP